eukprot:TRINITY_DN3077_c0_g1_i1.p1 TRINITY_DN3077_c0_g1~~TRINITY_DN3077_c0_g1_i1.p1  ORF type:complete len:705 (-),score=152.33 TRINITY_DN3077_c0_g1_i1:28-2106(-)
MSTNTKQPHEGQVEILPELTLCEKIPTIVFKESVYGSKYVAECIRDVIVKGYDREEPVVLGLATGSTPKRVYAELVRMHKEEELSFKNVVTFNLDEYYPLAPDHHQSYVNYMNNILFDHIDIPKENINIPDGTVSEDDLAEFCFDYEQKIDQHGGIDIQILGIGRTGHIGFNEPGSTKFSETRLVFLDKKTRADAAPDFLGLNNVPRRAITMGVGTILKAKKIYLMAWSEGKASIIQKAVEGEVSKLVTASFLQEHMHSEVVLDVPAASRLTRITAPWTSDSYFLDWDDDTLVKRAVVWLSLKKEKPILMLDNRDYMDAQLDHLVNQRGPVYNINRFVYGSISSTITGWPAGKPTQEFLDSYEPKELHCGSTTRVPMEYLEGMQPPSSFHPNIKNHHVYPKRILVFSPHPDDDVISMGGTFIRLNEQGHEVHVAYQTSGNIAVWDDDVKRYANFVKIFMEAFEIPNVDMASDIQNKIEEAIYQKTQDTPDSTELLKIKGLIRNSEARNAARYCGVVPENIHFLNLPFYETGTIQKQPLGDEDVSIVLELIREIRPHQIYCAGDLSDPHGTHRVCLTAIFRALDICKGDDWFQNCQVMLYRGAWEEWAPHEITLAVPLSPAEVLQKRYAIFKHQSQKDPIVFPGTDSREFWQRTEARNRDTAALFDKLGLPEYAAMEAFHEFDIVNGDHLPYM